jgi:hypothetical protein
MDKLELVAFQLVLEEGLMPVMLNWQPPFELDKVFLIVQQNFSHTRVTLLISNAVLYYWVVDPLGPWQMHQHKQCTTKFPS